MTARHRAPRCAVAAAAVVALVALVAAPAGALHQNCGERYPDGTRANGHPDLTHSGQTGWAGQHELNRLEAAVFTATSIKTGLLDGADVATAAAEIIHDKKVAALRALPDGPEQVADASLSTAETAARAVAIGLVAAGLVVLIAETTLLGQQRATSGGVAAENACNSVLGGDMLDHIWVSIIERNLLSDGPPLAVLLIPTDTREPGGESGEWPLQPQHEKDDFAWCSPISLPAELPTPAGETDLDQPNGPSTGGDCTPAVHDGFLNNPYDGAPRVTVQAIVRDAIDHARAHGLDVRSAEDHYTNAVTALGSGRYKEAFSHFRLAYRDAAGFDG